jgi:hypothetical protein
VFESGEILRGPVCDGFQPSSDHLESSEVWEL